MVQKGVPKRVRNLEVSKNNVMCWGIFEEQAMRMMYIRTYEFISEQSVTMVVLLDILKIPH